MVSSAWFYNSLLLSLCVFPLCPLCLCGSFMSDPFGIALFGCGTVGAGVAKLLLEQPERLAARAGRRLELRHVVVRDPDKARGVAVPRKLLSTAEAALADPAVQAVAELIGGVDQARRVVLDALAAGKHVVTPNKAPLSAHGP